MNICPCCGFPDLMMPAYTNIVFPTPIDARPPYEEFFGAPSYEVCSCCGFEFGNDDNPGTSSPVSFEDFRKEWLLEGAKWFDKNALKSTWNLEIQLLQIGVKLSDYVT